MTIMIMTMTTMMMMSMITMAETRATMMIRINMEVEKVVKVRVF